MARSEAVVRIAAGPSVRRRNPPKPSPESASEGRFSGGRSRPVPGAGGAKAGNDAPVRVFLAEERIRRKVRDLGRQIARDYAGKEVVLVGVLKGCCIFMSDLARAIDLPVTFDFLRVSSYGNGTESVGTVRIDFDVTQPLRGKHVILVEDIIDTGLTARAVMNTLRSKRPASLRLCALLHKPDRAQVPIRIDYLGFTIPNHFVVGYGLDYAGKYRNLPSVGILQRTS
ncbi:MAG: hypoxanthine phosphoribosyltransferase [Planctomycetes bacterium]|nr:hypoxanthine phosphoribosyltransferase [Planctomycetota bacterium]